MFSKSIRITGGILSIGYIGWYIYKRIECNGNGCWGNDLFFSIPAMALVPSFLEGNVLVKYVVVLVNACIIYGFFYCVGKIIALFENR